MHEREYITIRLFRLHTDATSNDAKNIDETTKIVIMMLVAGLATVAGAIGFETKIREYTTEIKEVLDCKRMNRKTYYDVTTEYLTWI